LQEQDASQEQSAGPEQPLLQLHDPEHLQPHLLTQEWQRQSALHLQSLPHAQGDCLQASLHPAP